MRKSIQPGISTRPPNGLRRTSDEIKERNAVTRAINAAIKQISAYDRELAETLQAEIKSGALFSHLPKAK
jgi:hypothetical protein